MLAFIVLLFGGLYAEVADLYLNWMLPSCVFLRVAFWIFQSRVNYLAYVHTSTCLTGKASHYKIQVRRISPKLLFFTSVHLQERHLLSASLFAVATVTYFSYENMQ